MYKLIHVPTGRELTTLNRMGEVWQWLDDNPGYERKDLMLRQYSHIQDYRLG